MKKNFKKALISAGAMVLPALALAEDSSGLDLSNVGSVLTSVRGILGTLVNVLIGVAVVVFIYGLIKYIVVTDDDGKKEARSVMMYGIIAIFVMVSIWGIVGFLRNAAGFNTSETETGFTPAIQ